MEIAKDFADWYRVAGMEPNGALLPLRWKGIEAFCKSIPRQSAIALLRNYCLPEPTDADIPAGFRDAFKAADTAFPMRDNLLELRVLAGASLRYLLTADREGLSNLAALGLVAGSFGPRTTALVVPEHVIAERSFIGRKGAEVRATEAQTEIKVPSFKEPFPDKAIFAGALTALEPHLSAAFTTLTSSFVTFAKAARDALIDTQHLANVQGEQADVLWWVLGGCDRQGGRVFDETPPSAVALMAAADLAELSRFLPGPPSAKAILIRVLLTTKTAPTSSASIADAVVSVDQDWRQAVGSRFDASEPSQLCPVLSAIAASLQRPASRDWAAQYDANCMGVPASFQIDISELADQLYTECLFIRSLGSVS